MSALSDLVREFWLQDLAACEGMEDVYDSVLEILDRQPPPPSALAEAFVARQYAKGLRAYGVTLEDAALSAAESAGLTAEELADVAQYLLNFVRRASDLLAEDDAEHLALLVLDVLNALNIVARYADAPDDLPPLVPTREAVERWGPWWWLGSDVVRVTAYDAMAYYHAGLASCVAVDDTDDWRGPVSPPPRGAR